jgi:hypothetical protein
MPSTSWRTNVRHHRPSYSPPPRPSFAAPPARRAPAWLARLVLPLVLLACAALLAYGVAVPTAARLTAAAAALDTAGAAPAAP